MTIVVGVEVAGPPTQAVAAVDGRARTIVSLSTVTIEAWRRGR
jgi:hypothetical protein